MRKLKKKKRWWNFTPGEKTTEAANPWRHLGDAPHELSTSVDIHASVLVRHYASTAGARAGHGGAPHP
jgi:hypothetical protein